MAYPFERTLRSLNGYESGTRVLLVVMVTIAVGGLAVWAAAAEVPVMKVSSQGRVEPHNAVYRLEPPAAGRVVRSMLNLDQDVKEGDLLIEFDTRSERLELEQSKTTSVALEQELSVIREQIANKREELAASGLVDEVAVREAQEREGELVPRNRLAKQRAQLAQQSPSGSISELEKLERVTEVDALDSASRAQSLAVLRLRREQAVRRQTLTAQVLGLKREELRAEGQQRELKVAVDRLEYQIEKKHYRAAASGRLVDVVELGAGAFIADGQRVGTILATDAQVRVRARFPKEMVGLIQPGQTAQLKLDGYPWTIYGTVPARVARVGTEPGIAATPEAIPGTVRVELDIRAPSDPRIQLRHGLTATVEVEVARVSPIALLLRAIGEWHVTEAAPEERRARAFQAESEAR
ncbi:MAG: HlyD family efflux transporter periplasmic adaptor subunit [Deltaproteobacteria bacterium]|nr:MAG: HlyD family efflux transporter periplasmic adaptor subunit [Deltaproteobacteria bacterium]TMQ13894.1 MAG: HlyD family efflux transporter periplasmic adaptor subunit [Deltaproteobacteria bacterium]